MAFFLSGVSGNQVAPTHKNERTSFLSLLIANVNVFWKFSHIHRNDAVPGALASCAPLKVTHNTKYHEKKREWKGLEEKLNTLTKLSIQWWELTELVQEATENGGVSGKPMSNSYWTFFWLPPSLLCPGPIFFHSSPPWRSQFRSSFYLSFFFSSHIPNSLSGSESSF